MRRSGKYHYDSLGFLILSFIICIGQKPCSNLTRRLCQHQLEISSELLLRSLHALPPCPYSPGSWSETSQDSDGFLSHDSRWVLGRSLPLAPSSCQKKDPAVGLCQVMVVTCFEAPWLRRRQQRERVGRSSKRMRKNEGQRQRQRLPGPINKALNPRPLNP